MYKRTKGSRRMQWDVGTYPSIRLKVRAHTHTHDIITYFRFSLDVSILINSTYNVRAATCGPLMMVAHTNARIIDYVMQCLVYI